MEEKKEIRWRIGQACDAGDGAGRRIGEHIRAVTAETKIEREMVRFLRIKALV